MFEAVLEVVRGLQRVVRQGVVEHAESVGQEHLISFFIFLFNVSFSNSSLCFELVVGEIVAKSPCQEHFVWGFGNDFTSYNFKRTL